MTEAEFDRVLTGWFRDGPDVLPGDLVGNALVEVATTRQDRTIRPRASRTLRSSRLTSALIAAGVVITVLVSLAAGIDLGLVGSSPTATTDPSSSPTSAPSGAARASTPITSNSDGFSLVLPGDWRWAAPRAPNSQRFEDRPADRSLTVSVGDSVIDGGTAAACAPAKSNMVECGDLTIGYSIPYLTARSYEALDASLRGFLDRCDGPCPITRSETRLGPDQAIRLEVTIDDRHLTYIAAMHGYRPVVLSWDEPSETADPTIIDNVRKAFTYVGEDPAATPRVYVDPLAPTTFRNEAAGYEVSLPASWIDGIEADETVIFDGLTIIAGDPDGRVHICGAYHWACGDEPIKSLEALESAVVSTPNGMTARESHSDTTLGGEPARIESLMTSGGYLLGPPAWYSVYAVHNGRPYVLAFDHWKLSRGDLDRSFVEQVRTSFHFID